jgi:hypothetical protein
MAIAGSLVSVLFTLPSTSIQKRIKVHVDRILYGGYYDFTTVTSDFSNHLAQAVDRPSFVNLLTYDLPKQMKITKSALLLLSDDGLSLQDTNVGTCTIQLSNEICQVLATLQHPAFAQNIWQTTGQELLDGWKSFHGGHLFEPGFANPQHDWPAGIIIHCQHFSCRKIARPFSAIGTFR